MLNKNILTIFSQITLFQTNFRFWCRSFRLLWPFSLASEKSLTKFVVSMNIFMISHTIVKPVVGINTWKWTFILGYPNIYLSTFFFAIMYTLFHLVQRMFDAYKLDPISTNYQKFKTIQTYVFRYLFFVECSDPFDMIDRTDMKNKTHMPKVKCYLIFIHLFMYVDTCKEFQLLIKYIEN